MQIMVVGDSFSAHKTEPESWINQLATLVDGDVTSFGQAGCSNYSIMNQYIKNNYEKYDVVIVIKTAPNRIPFIKNAYHLSFFIDPDEKVNSILPKNYKEALEIYLKFYYDLDFCTWVSQQSWYSILNKKPEKQKIIWIDVPSNNTDYNLEKQNSIITIGNLIKIHQKEILSEGYKNIKEFRTKNPTEIGKYNHLSPINNYNFAIFLKNIIFDEKANRDLQKHSWTFT